MIPVESLNRCVSQPQFEAFNTVSCSFQLGMNMAIQCILTGTYWCLYSHVCLRLQDKKEV